MDRTNVLIALAATVSAIFAGFAAIFAGLTWRTYVRMNSILTKTNEINEQMVVTTRSARFHSSAPVLIAKMGGVNAAENSDADRAAYWVIDRLFVRNAGRGNARSIVCDPEWQIPLGAIDILEPGQERTMRKIHVPRESENKADIKLALRYSDDHGNEWEATVLGADTTQRLVRDVIEEATRRPPVGAAGTSRPTDEG